MNVASETFEGMKMEEVFCERISEIIYKDKVRGTILPILSTVLKENGVKCKKAHNCEIIQWTTSIFTNMRLFHCPALFEYRHDECPRYMILYSLCLYNRNNKE